MVVDKCDSLIVSPLQTFSDLARKMQLDLKPLRHGFKERPQTGRSKGEVGFQKPFKFQKWLFVKYDIVQILDTDSSLFEAIVDCHAGKTGVMLDSSETFFLGRGDYFSIYDQSGGAVVVIG
jgi:hypothetical protein